MQLITEHSHSILFNQHCFLELELLHGGSGHSLATLNLFTVSAGSLVTVGASEALVALTAVTKHLGELTELDTSQEKSPAGLIFRDPPDER